MRTLPQGQYIKHVQYGLGVVTQSDAERTSIDFHLHGLKKFATKIMVVELTDEAPPPKPPPVKCRRGSTQLPPVTISASGKYGRRSASSGVGFEVTALIPECTFRALEVSSEPREW
jgi:hypothetical protein